MSQIDSLFCLTRAASSTSERARKQFLISFSFLSMMYGLLGLMVFALGGTAAAAEIPSPYATNEQAVTSVNAGDLSTASAAWWGFNTKDVTDTLQAAIDSKAKTPIIPYMGQAWIVRPLNLRSDLEIVFEPGVLVLAKRGEFKGKGDSLFTASEVTNLTLRGYGTTLRMRKKDYQNPPYEKAEWRHALVIRGCENVLIEGLRIESSGGDGIMIDGGGKGVCSKDVTVRSVVCFDNHRQGMSVTSVQNLLVEGCSLTGTSGTAPESGVDIEPDSPDQRLVKCVFRNCLFENNSGNAAAIYLKNQTSESEPVSITFENCVARMGKAGDLPDVVRAQGLGGWGGFAIGAIRDNGPKGLIELINCVTENTGREGARIYDNSSQSVKLRFVRCSFKNPWLTDPLDWDRGPKSPISITLRRAELTTKMGGVEFIDCQVFDTVDRPALVVRELKSQSGVQDLTGSITVHNPHGVRADFGVNPRNVTPDLVHAVK
jgi:hypothetical protein